MLEVDVTKNALLKLPKFVGRVSIDEYIEDDTLYKDDVDPIFTERLMLQHEDNEFIND